MNLQRYRASAALEQFLKDRSGPYFICGTEKCQINTLEELQAFKQRHGECWQLKALPVFPYSPDSPFSEEGDAAYQAWHDRAHARGGYTFDLAGETELALDHFAEAIRAGLCCEDALALFYMVRSRVAYMEKHGGNNPPDRAQFITACFQLGETCAINGDYMEQYANLTCK